MGSYEKQQAYLQKLMEECILNDDEEEPPLDESDEGEEDAVQLDPHETDSEQDISDTEESVSQESVEPIFIGKDQSTKWRKHCPPKNVRTRSENLVTHLPGPKGLARTLRTPISLWQYFFSEQCLQLIVQNTNKHIQSVQERYSRERDAKLTDIVELKALIGLLYLAGVMKSSHLNAEDLWRVDGTGIEIFRLTMSLQRFRFLLRHLRFDDLETREARKSLDRLAAIREVFDMFVDNCKSAFTPFHYVTVDEKLEAFREVYVGKQPAGPWQVNNSPDAVVERMCEPIKGTGRNVTADNWFTSELSIEFACPVNRPEKSSMFGFNETCTVVSYIPKKRKNVLLMSSLHRDDDIDSVTGKPDIIMTYNQTKGGVDTVDKLCSVYNCARST
nr:unnamed protein product [Callosobruchus chinensis]